LPFKTSLVCFCSTPKHSNYADIKHMAPIYATIIVQWAATSGLYIHPADNYLEVA